MNTDTPYHRDSGKPRLELVPPELVEAAARAFGFGAEKYGPWNWWQYRREFEIGRLLGSIYRHLAAFSRCEDVDAESGLCPLDHAAADLAMLLALRSNGLGVDNRRAPSGNATADADALAAHPVRPWGVGGYC